MNQPRLKTAVPPRALGAEELLPFLRRSFDEWTPDDGTGEIGHKLVSIRSSIESGGSQTFTEVLTRTIHSDQVDWALEEAFLAHGTRMLVPQIARDLARQQRTLSKQPRETCLEVCCGVQVHSISFPDPSRDELVIELTIASGTDIDQLLAFMVQEKLLAEEHVKATRVRWTERDASIGHLDEERRILEKCLAVRLDDMIVETSRPVKYNYGYQSRKIWRTFDTLVTVRAPLDLRYFPFDSSHLTYYLRGEVDFDASERLLQEDVTADYSAEFSRTIPPRGFRVMHASTSLEPLVVSRSRDTLPESVLRLGFELRRNAGTMIWRILVPALV